LLVNAPALHPHACMSTREKGEAEEKVKINNERGRAIIIKTVPGEKADLEPEEVAEKVAEFASIRGSIALGRALRFIEAR
jgi:hypothetical protein